MCSSDSNLQQIPVIMEINCFWYLSLFILAFIFENQKSRPSAKMLAQQSKKKMTYKWSDNREVVYTCYTLKNGIIKLLFKVKLNFATSKHQLFFIQFI